jgi:hypothetical protein
MTTTQILCNIYAVQYRNQFIDRDPNRMYLIPLRLKNLDRQYGKLDMKELCRQEGVSL